MKRIDLVGQKFGKLTVIKSAPNRRGRTAWLCLCDCGQEKIIVGKELKNGDTKSCGCLAIELQSGKAALMIKAKTKFTPIIAAARYAWRRHYSNIIFEEFYNLVQQNCYYCGSVPSNKIYLKWYNNRSKYAIENGIFIYNGLDRVNSSLEHTIDNVVPCCWICNRAKNNRTTNQFILYIINLISNKNNRININRYINNSLIINTDFLMDKNKYPYKSSINRTFTSVYNDGDLTMKQFYQLSQLNCYYCGQIPSNVSHSSVKASSEFYKLNDTFIYSGLDRIDNNLPHNYDNVIPSCKYCNYAKQNLKLIEFYQWIDKLEKQKELIQNGELF